MKILVICPFVTEYKFAKHTSILSAGKKLYGFNYAEKKINQSEILFVNSGMGKTRASAATAVFSSFFKPDLVIDSGSCGSLQQDLLIGNIIFSYSCYEYDISGTGFPVKQEKRMRIRSGFTKSDEKKITDIWKPVNAFRFGIQASGEFIIRDTAMKNTLVSLFDASACNCETAGVFFPAISMGIPCISLRVISDFADQNVSFDFRKHIRASLTSLYSFILISAEKNLFSKLLSLYNNDSTYISR